MSTVKWLIQHREKIWQLCPPITCTGGARIIHEVNLNLLYLIALLFNVVFLPPLFYQVAFLGGIHLLGCPSLRVSFKIFYVFFFSSGGTHSPWLQS